MEIVMRMCKLCISESFTLPFRVHGDYLKWNELEAQESLLERLCVHTWNVWPFVEKFLKQVLKHTHTSVISILRTKNKHFEQRTTHVGTNFSKFRPLMITLSKKRSLCETENTFKLSKIARHTLLEKRPCEYRYISAKTFHDQFRVSAMIIIVIHTWNGSPFLEKLLRRALTTKRWREEDPPEKENASRTEFDESLLQRLTDIHSWLGIDYREITVFLREFICKMRNCIIKGTQSMLRKQRKSLALTLFHPQYCVLRSLNKIACAMWT